VGALAITDYPEDWVNDVDKNLELATLFRLLGPVFIEQIQNNELLQQSEWSTINQEVHKIFSKLKSQINASTTQLNQSALFQQVIEGVSFQLKSYGFIAKLDSQTHEFEILGIHGYPKEVSDRLLNGRIFALPENEQGPVPLAINRKQTVIVSDVRLLRGVLHENTNFFFDRAGTRSCAAVPIFESKTDALGSLQEKTIWGILFLERNITEPFTLKSTTGLEQVSDEIDNLLSDVNQKLIFEKTQKALSSLLPERVLQKVIDQKLEREEDYGTLLMIDLKESTKIALEVGSDVWLKNAQSLLPTIDEIARRHNLTLQTFIWDAFYLTYSSETPSEQVVVRMLDFINEISQEIEKWYQQHYGSLFLNSGIRKQKARFCLTFGDTSRGFVEGKTRSWSIVGGEMSCISKFEDVCKKLDGVVFADESIRAGLDPLVWNSTNQQVPSTRRNIYVASVSWQDLMQRGFPNTKAA
jgi:class 3 adenylate cyclase